MTGIPAALAVFWADVRSMRRLVRTWVFVVLSLLFGFGLYLQYTTLHTLLSSASPSVGYLSPRFLMSLVGENVITIFLLAIIALGFDTRVRDERERVLDVLDSRPIGNLGLLLGRLAALVVVTWTPMLFLFGVIFAIPYVTGSLNREFGEPVEVVSLLAMLTLQALPALALWGSIVMFVAVVAKNRVVVIAVAFAALALHTYGTAQAPMHLGAALAGLTPTSNGVVSDMLPRFATPIEYMQRGSLVVLTAGMLLLTSAVYPRRDGSRRVPLTMCAGMLLVAGVAATVLMVRSVVDGAERRVEWLAAHDELNGVVRPDVHHVAGRVVIDPGESLLVDLDIALGPTGEPLPELVFTLNPGMRVESVEVDGRTVAYRHELGLLVVEDPHAGTGGNRVLSVLARGIPDPAFAYLDSAVDVGDSDVLGVELLYLGTEPSLFEHDYVALVPGVHWMPTPGPATGGVGPTVRARGGHTLDLSVEVPPHWLVAGPGLRAGSDGNFRFRPAGLVTDVALMASVFERRAASVAGVVLEVLLSPKHLQNVDFFAETGTQLVARLGNTFAELERGGTPYPYRGLSAVEVPAPLRLYEGGWRMESAQAHPGVLLLREHGFPTAKFDNHLDGFDSKEERVAAKLNMLEAYFESDTSGGNPYYGLARNVWFFQTAASGDGGLAMDALGEQLATLLISPNSAGFFSLFEAMQVGAAVQTLVQGRAGPGAPLDDDGRRVTGIADTARRLALHRPTVWEAALATPLSELATEADVRAVHGILGLRIPPIARYLFDEIGREGVARLLAHTLGAHRGDTYTAGEFDALVQQNGASLRDAFGDWLTDASLPGFVASDIDVQPGSEASYQLLVHVRNGEPAPGPGVLVFADQSSGEETQSAPIHVGGYKAVEVGAVVEQAPGLIWFAPYLSLNRGRVPLQLPDFDWRGGWAGEVRQPFRGSRESAWRPTELDGVVVDDLSDGFRVVYGPQSEGLRLAGSRAQDTAELDRGVPVSTDGGEGWQRETVSGAIGQYRRTMVRTKPGDGNAWAVFAATLPVGGRWRAEYHLPTETIGQLGSYEIEVTSDGPSADSGAVFFKRPVEFDGSAGQRGWNSLGEFEIAEGENIRLSVSDETTGSIVVADAIRWLPVAN